MSDELQKHILSLNLNRLLEESGKKQSEVAEAIGVSPQTFNTWVQGIAMPRMGKVQKLADYFNVLKSDLIEDSSDGHYLNSETAAIAQEIHDNRELRMLFSATKDVSPETLKELHDVLQILKRRENND